jgi:hypothetical protein
MWAIYVCTQPGVNYPVNGFGGDGIASVGSQLSQPKHFGIEEIGRVIEGLQRVFGATIFEYKVMFVR